MNEWEIFGSWNNRLQKESDILIDENQRVIRRHECEHCHRIMEYDDQQCACTSKSNRLGYNP